MFILDLLIAMSIVSIIVYSIFVSVQDIVQEESYNVKNDKKHVIYKIYRKSP